ncbi:unnamed protein product [Paramecium primaurelia]|uniref:Uncharacterized protein n=1 Tax=Paramecium primaurelia TaxID=5886 RepID=A0A8S1N0I3_PARPR|nr:unnamed protein product [Paramecium primaurelia]
MLIKQIKEILQLKRNFSEDKGDNNLKLNNFNGFLDQHQRWVNGQKRLENCLQRIARLDDGKQKSDEFFYTDSTKQMQYEFSLLLAKQLLKQITNIMLNNKFQDYLNYCKQGDDYLQSLLDKFQYIQNSDSKYQEQEIDTRKYLFEITIKYFKSINIDYLRKIVNQQRSLEYYVNQIQEAILELFYEDYILKQQTEDYTFKIQEQKKKILNNNPKDQNSLITQKLKQQLPEPNNHELGYENKEINVFCALSNDEQYGKVLEEALLFDSFYCDKLLTNQSYHNQKQRKFKVQSQKYSKQDLEHFISHYKVSQLRMTKKHIGELNKTDYSNRYYQTREQRIKSENNKSRIIEVTDKINKRRINTIQQFFKNDPEIKRQENKEVIDFLVNYNYKNVPKTLQNFIIHQNSNEEKDISSELLHKLFFKYSNKYEEDSSQTFQFMNAQNFISLCKDLKTQISSDEGLRIFHKCLEDQSFFLDKGLTYSFFLDAIRNLASITNEIDTNNPEFQRDANQVRFRFSKKEIEQNSDPQQKINKFLQIYIFPNKTFIYESIDLQLQNCQYYTDFLEAFNPLIAEFFQNSKNEQSQFINFDDVVKVFMKIKLCPSKITKATLRYYFYYNQIEDEGLNLQQFHNFLNLLALQQNRKIISSKETSNVIQYYTYIFEQKNGISNDTIALYKKIMMFYIHRDYLRLLRLTKLAEFSVERRESYQDF